MLKLEHFKRKRECDTYLKAMARLVISTGDKEFSARALDGVGGMNAEFQARRLQDLLNKDAGPPFESGQWTSDVTPQDRWYVTTLLHPEEVGVILLRCYFDQVANYRAWTVHT